MDIRYLISFGTNTNQRYGDPDKPERNIDITEKLGYPLYTNS